MIQNYQNPTGGGGSAEQIDRMIFAPGGYWMNIGKDIDENDIIYPTDIVNDYLNKNLSKLYETEDEALKVAKEIYSKLFDDFFTYFEPCVHVTGDDDDPYYADGLNKVISHHKVFHELDESELHSIAEFSDSYGHSGFYIKEIGRRFYNYRKEDYDRDILFGQICEEYTEEKPNYRQHFFWLSILKGSATYVFDKFEITLDDYQGGNIDITEHIRDTTSLQKSLQHLYNFFNYTGTKLPYIKINLPDGLILHVTIGSINRNENDLCGFHGFARTSDKEFLIDYDGNTMLLNEVSE